MSIMISKNILILCVKSSLIAVIFTLTILDNNGVSAQLSAPYLGLDPTPDFKTKNCGDREKLGKFNGWLPDDGYAEIYHLNETADRLQNEGYRIENIHLYGDAIFNFTYSKAGQSHSLGFLGTGVVKAVGGKDATEQRALYMALIGQRKKDNGKTLWLCDGSVINREWILTAAHCFADINLNPDVIRLGDYNWKDEKNEEFFGKFIPIDYDFKPTDVKLHPQFDGTARYHDIALIRLPRPYPMFSQNINPICLPWGDQLDINHIGSKAVLSGWGAIQYSAINGVKHPILQEVDLDVFETSVCQRSYSKLLDFDFKWPQGMTSDQVLCAGATKGGKDACKGDSGAPLVYERPGPWGGPLVRHYPPGSYTQMGVVSGGYGCGLAEYPGLYMPINNRHLSWIKSVAFVGYRDAQDKDLSGSGPRLSHSG